MTKKKVRFWRPSWASKFHGLEGRIPDFFLGGGALVSCCTSTLINHIVVVVVVVVFFFLQNTSCIRKPQVISGRGGGVAHPLHPPARSAPPWTKATEDDESPQFCLSFLGVPIRSLQDSS